jgi:hypothetical protein
MISGLANRNIPVAVASVVVVIVTTVTGLYWRE